MSVKRNRCIRFQIILTSKWRISFMNVLRNEQVQNVGKRARGTLNDFEKFILRGNVVDLAVGIVSVLPSPASSTPLSVASSLLSFQLPILASQHLSTPSLMEVSFSSELSSMQ